MVFVATVRVHTFVFMCPILLPFLPICLSFSFASFFCRTLLLPPFVLSLISLAQSAERLLPALALRRRLLHGQATRLLVRSHFIMGVLLEPLLWWLRLSGDLRCVLILVGGGRKARR
jgi:hypothetical protein